MSQCSPNMVTEAISKRVDGHINYWREGWRESVRKGDTESDHILEYVYSNGRAH